MSLNAPSTLLLATSVMTFRCLPCTVFHTPVPVGPNFQVKVESYRGLADSLRLVLTASGTRTAAETDRNGIALFHDVPPGLHDLKAEIDNSIFDGVVIEVKLDGPASVTVPFKWPGAAVVAVRSLRGTIHAPGYPPGRPQPRLSLDLLESRSRKTLKNVETTETGEFNYEWSTPGIYFLQLKPSGLRDSAGYEITGLIAVAVDPEVPTDHLDLDLGWSSCGLWVSDRSKCRQAELRTDRLSGRLHDVTEGAIPDADIVLLDPSGKLVEELRSDRKGYFASPRQLAGTYQLVVIGTGFTPFRGILHAGPSTSPALHPALNVQLGIFGACSIANAQ